MENGGRNMKIILRRTDYMGKKKKGIIFLEKENDLLEDIATCKEPCDDNSMSM